MPKLNGILESFLFVEDVQKSCHFFKNILGLKLYSGPDERGCFFELPGNQMLGIMNKNEAESPNPIPNGTIPACTKRTPNGPTIGHMAFKIPGESFDIWYDHMNREGIKIEEIVEWNGGGKSLYFRDPDGHLIELVTPGIWEGVY